MTTKNFSTKMIYQHSWISKATKAIVELEDSEDNTSVNRK
jgi:hypothetical protein